MATVPLTDELGKILGEADILTAHTGKGLLHKAFSVYVFHGEGAKRELLIQRRSKEKMLWPLFWANTCCSHPKNGEMPIEAGARRLKEELGASCELREAESYVYRAEDQGRGVEHEYVTMLTGEASPEFTVKPDPREIAEWKWIDVASLLKDFDMHPELYAPWFPLGLKLLLSSQ